VKKDGEKTNGVDDVLLTEKIKEDIKPDSPLL
jgi:hypothetical protein